MSDSEPVYPLFVPPLAVTLASAERARGRPLTQAEAIQIRDAAPVIMMHRDDIVQMEGKRGFVNVNPENCWSDWHRLRSQMVGGYLPKIILCVPGDSAFRSRCEPMLVAEGVEYEFRGREDQIIKAFTAASLGSGSCNAAANLARVAGHDTVLYILSKNFTSSEAAGACLRFLTLGRRLLEAGGIAIKCDSSGIAHAGGEWIRLSEAAERCGVSDGKTTDITFWVALRRAYVQLPIASSDELYSCGMHLLGAPDLIANSTVIAAEGCDAPHQAVADVFTVFAEYILGECAVGAFGSGHTFHVDARSPRYRLLWEPCTGYDEDDYFFNPFGRWRFTRANC